MPDTATLTVMRTTLSKTYWIKSAGAPETTTAHGESIVVHKVVLECRSNKDGPKTKVICFGRPATRSWETRSTNFNVKGYTQYRECPEWLAELIKDGFV